MKKLIYLIFISSLLLLQSCSNFLDIQPKGYVIPSKYEDYRRLMYYPEMNKASEVYPNYITDDAALSGGDSILNFTSMEECPKNLYSFKHGAIFNDGTSDYLWDLTYNRIYIFNTIINNVLNTTDATKEERERLWAQALVGRSFEYLTLIGAYAPTYNPSTANTDLGVPIVDKEDLNNFDYKRNTVAEVYKKITDDLNAAMPKLSQSVNSNFLPGKNVGYGFLARMYLMMGNYEKSLYNAVEALKLNEKLVDYKLYTTDPFKFVGRIMLKEDNNKGFPELHENPESIYSRLSPFVFGLSYSVLASKDLEAVYERDLPQGAIDKRMDLWFVSKLSWDDSFEGKYKLYLPYYYINLGMNNMEMMLTAAECYARKGDAASLTEAAKWYNKLRDMRIEGNVHYTFKNAEEALFKILDERRREFAFVGLTRLIDLKRLNTDPRFAKTVFHNVNGKEESLPPNDPRYILPLPPKVKEFKPDLPDYKR